MAELNTGIFSSIIGILKLLTVVIGVVDLGLTANKYLKDSREEYFLAIVIILFILSTVFIVLALIGVLNDDGPMIKVDFAFHVIGGFLLFIGAIVWFVSISRSGGKFLWCSSDNILKGKKCNGPYAQRVFSGLFGMLNSVLYLGIGGLIFRSGSVV